MKTRKCRLKNVISNRKLEAGLKIKNYKMENKSEPLKNSDWKLKIRISSLNKCD